MSNGGESRTENNNISLITNNQEHAETVSEDECSLVEEVSSSCEVQYDSDMEKNYFGDNICISESSEQNTPVWADSESYEEELRKEYETHQDWINEKKFKKYQEIEVTKISIESNLGIFKANYAVKIMKQKDSFLCLVDTMNLIYIFDKLELITTFKFDKWRVSDIEFYEDKIYFCNEKFDKLKEFNKFKKETKTINKVLTKNIRKLKNINEFLYILGDTTLVVDEYLNVINEVYDRVIDISNFMGEVYGLNENGDILKFTNVLKLTDKTIYEDKFSFRSLYAISKFLIVNTSSGLNFINRNMECVKETKELNTKVVGICETSDIIVYFTENRNGIKVLDRNLQYYDVNTKLPPCKMLVTYGDGIVISSGRELHFIKINQYVVRK